MKGLKELTFEQKEKIVAKDDLNKMAIKAGKKAFWFLIPGASIACSIYVLFGEKMDKVEIGLSLFICLAVCMLIGILFFWKLLKLPKRDEQSVDCLFNEMQKEAMVKLEANPKWVGFKNLKYWRKERESRRSNKLLLKPSFNSPC